MSEFSGTIIGLYRAAVSDQIVLSADASLTHIDKAGPLRQWIIQVCIIICTANLLSLVREKFRQPKVVAELVGGIILGPTVCGRIPGFTNYLFPEDSLPILALFADIGLCLFLFLVGMEVDAGAMKRSAKLSAPIALAGITLPFVLGLALSPQIYEHFVPPEVEFNHFVLFIGVTSSITAFPALCRILTELKLLDTTVGVLVLSTGVAVDIVGWSLLALCIALVNAESELTALYTLLACVAFATFLLIPGKIVLHWIARKTGSIESGPTMSFITVTLIFMLASSFFTDMIGVHAIFGAFLTGLIVPRENELIIALTGKLEDMVAIIFLPLYFTISGLRTDLSLLNDRFTWGFAVIITVLSFTGKFGGCTLAARYLSGISWRESATIGSFMSCKGLIELIVLNIGLYAKILNQRVFSMFIFEALVLTAATTPLVTMFYPPRYRVRISETEAKFECPTNDEEGQASSDGGGNNHRSRDKRSPSWHHHREDDLFPSPEKKRFTIVLDTIEHLSGAMAVTQPIIPMLSGFNGDDFATTDDPAAQNGDAQEDDLIATGSYPPSGEPATASITASSSSSIPPYHVPSLQINALRLIKVSDRISAQMKSHDISTLPHTDPVLSIYQMFTSLQGVNVLGELKVVPEEDIVSTTVERANNFGAEMVVIPWVLHPSAHSLVGAIEKGLHDPQTPYSNVTHNPFADLFKSKGDTGTSTTTDSEVHTRSRPGGHGHWSTISEVSLPRTHFIRSVFAKSDVDVGLYIDQSGIVTTLAEPPGLLSSALGFSDSGCGLGSAHILLPFIGGPDDRLALEFVVGLCSRNEHLRATVVRLKKVGRSGENDLGQGKERNQPSNIKDEEYDTARTAVASDVPVFPDSVYGQATTEVLMQSEMADCLIWRQYATPDPIPLSSEPSSPSQAPIPIITPRIAFKEIMTAKPLHVALDEARAIQRAHTQWRNAGSVPRSGVIIVTGRSRRLAVESHRAELKEIIEEDACGGDVGGSLREVRNTVGEVGCAFVGRGVGVGIWVLQAALGRDR